MLEQCQLAADNAANEAIHGDMEFRIIILHGHKEFIDRYQRIELLFYFSDESLLRSCTGFYLAAREFLPVLPGSVSTLGRKEHTVFYQYCSNNFYRSAHVYLPDTVLFCITFEYSFLYKLCFQFAKAPEVRF